MLAGWSGYSRAVQILTSGRSADPSSTAGSRRSWAVLGLALVLTAGACSTGAIGSGDFSVADHVAELPAGDEPALLSVGDLQTATEAAGLDRPDADSAEVAPWLFALTTSPDTDVFVPTPPTLTQSIDQEGGDELGWTLAQVQTFAHTSLLPRQTVIVSGDFDEDALSADLQDLGDEVYSAGSGQDLEASLTEATAVRPTGIPLRLAVADGVIMVDTHEQEVRDWVQGSDRATFADDEEVLALAEALDAHEVYAATIATGSGPLQTPAAISAEQAAQVRGEWEQWAISEPFGVAGAGWAMVDDEPVVLAAYHFGDADSARLGQLQAQTLWQEGRTSQGRELSEMFTFQQVHQDGPVVVVTLHLGEQGSPQHVHQMFLEQEVTFGYLE